MSTPPANDVFIHVTAWKEIRDYIETGLPGLETPADYRAAIDELNAHFKNFPEFIKTNTLTVDAALVIGYTQHVENNCRLQDRQHVLEDCIKAQFERQFERYYEIAQRLKSKTAERPMPDFSNLYAICVLRSKVLYDAMRELYRNS